MVPNPHEPRPHRAGAVSWQGHEICDAPSPSGEAEERSYATTPRRPHPTEYRGLAGRRKQRGQMVAAHRPCDRCGRCLVQRRSDSSDRRHTGHRIDRGTRSANLSIANSMSRTTVRPSRPSSTQPVTSRSFERWSTDATRAIRRARTPIQKHPSPPGRRRGGTDRQREAIRTREGTGLVSNASRREV